MRKVPVFHRTVKEILFIIFRIPKFSLSPILWEAELFKITRGFFWVNELISVLENSYFRILMEFNKNVGIFLGRYSIKMKLQHTKKIEELMKKIIPFLSARQN